MPAGVQPGLGLDDQCCYDIRVVTIDGDPWFLAKDVCDALGYSHVSSALRDNINPSQAITVRVAHGIRGNPNQKFISEGGLYSLVLGSKKPEAKAFKLWVTDHVLPAIRKDGMYVQGEEKVKTGEMTIEEMELRVFEHLKQKTERCG